MSRNTRSRTRAVATLLVGALPIGAALIPTAAQATGGAPISVTATISGTPSASGWYGGPQTVHLEVSAESVESGSWAISQNGGEQHGLLDTSGADLTVSGEGTSSVSWSVTADGGRRAQGSVELKIDASDPKIEVFGLPDGQRFNQGADMSFSFRCTDAVSGVVSCLDGNGKPTGSKLDTSSRGAKSATVTAFDAAGHRSLRTVPYEVWAPDTTPPVMSGSVVSGTKRGAWYTSPVVFRAEAIDATVPFETRTGLKTLFTKVDGTMLETTQPTRDLTLSADGHHELTYAALDNAGNPSVMKSFSADVDQTPPEIAVTYPTPGLHLTSASSDHVEMTCSDATSGVDACTSTALDLTPGVHTSQLTAVDKAGNLSTRTIPYVVDAPSRTGIRKVALSSTRKGAVTVRVRAEVGVVGLIKVYADRKLIGTWDPGTHRGAASSDTTVKVPVSKVGKGTRRVVAVYEGSNGALPSKSKVVVVRVK